MKLHTNEPITTDDIAELEVVLIDAGVATPDDLDRAAAQAGHLGAFVRSLVGLDRNAAKTAFADFLDEQRYNADQITFVNLLIDELTAAGVVPARRLLRSPVRRPRPRRTRAALRQRGPGPHLRHGRRDRTPLRSGVVRDTEVRARDTEVRSGGHVPAPEP
ncbi:MAG: type I restriction-modification enzyme R subunit C-terminal domain-containing protein [Microthrixaceae bacterium]